MLIKCNKLVLTADAVETELWGSSFLSGDERFGETIWIIIEIIVEIIRPLYSYLYTDSPAK